MGHSRRSRRWPGFWGFALAALLAWPFAAPGAGTDLPTDLPAALNVLLNVPQRLESVGAALEAFFALSPADLRGGSPPPQPADESTLLQAPVVLTGKDLPPHCAEAIFDFRLSARKDFQTYAGAADGWLDRGQFNRLVADGRLPVKTDPDAYFAAHDIDGDGRLTIGEFSPTATEVARSQDVAAITTAFLTNRPYPTGARPVSSPRQVPGVGTGPAPGPGPPPGGPGLPGDPDLDAIAGTYWDKDDEFDRLSREFGPRYPGLRPVAMDLRALAQRYVDTAEAKFPGDPEIGRWRSEVRYWSDVLFGLP
ncbi:MAG: hypothetical protein GX442_13155 [Candidatus Riflebacteria bacterium]|nr:hypothetical protein [Candidatus Riflebacteria bacterium]